MKEQLPLSLSLQDDATFDNFYSSDNAQCKAFLNSPTDRFIYLWSSTAAGKTHLLQACCHHAIQQGLTATYIPLSEADMLSPDMLEGLEQIDVICLDDLQVIAGNKHWEEQIFHLYNRVKDGSSYLVFSSNKPIKSLGILLPDLVSRLTACVIFNLTELSDGDKVNALQMRAKRRGLHLSAEVGEFLIHRWPRNLNSLFAVLETLDHASLAEKRKLTIPFIKSVLSI